ncbi:MAG TPA: hypothetical protein VFU86_06755 [Terriglobales bacterium]|nr:hypothetical protein [Terriglobales bacterium]
MEDIRQEGLKGTLSSLMTAVIVDGPEGKEYRTPTAHEIAMASMANQELERVFSTIPFGLPRDPLPSKEALGFRVPLYGFDQWQKLFTPRQLLAMGTFIAAVRKAPSAAHAAAYPDVWREAVCANLAITIDKLADYISSICTWHITGEKMSHVFVRFALPMTWDYAELNPLSNSSGNYLGCLDWVARVSDHTLSAMHSVPPPKVRQSSAILADQDAVGVDIVLTDPPYYDAIPYSDLMDFFYVWLRRTLYGLFPELDQSFQDTLGPKWDSTSNDGELIDDSSRFGGDDKRSKAAYEDGMYRAFRACCSALKPDGRLVIVFAHKDPDAWETLVSAMIRACYVVDASWPIQTEMGNRTRAQSSAALSSSVWLVCRKRPDDARPGWDNLVLEEMRQRISTRLRNFWDAGIRGPDFVWAATGPALEAYSKHPVVKKANDPGKIMEVSEFLRHVRRLVVDFVVGRVLSHNGDIESVGGLDDVTTYYLLHRHDFGMDEAPIGPCILYAISCGLSDRELADQYDILVRTGGSQSDEDEESDAESTGEDESSDAAKGTGSRVKLKSWQQRQRRTLGFDAESKPAPLVDQVHRLMHLWKAGNVAKVDDYLDSRGLRANHLFHHLLQALIELADQGSEDRSLLESISNHVAVRGVAPEKSLKLAYDQVSTVPEEN